MLTKRSAKPERPFVVRSIAVRLPGQQPALPGRLAAVGRAAPSALRRVAPIAPAAGRQARLHPAAPVLAARRAAPVLAARRGAAVRWAAVGGDDGGVVEETAVSLVGKSC